MPLVTLRSHPGDALLVPSLDNSICFRVTPRGDLRRGDLKRVELKRDSEISKFSYSPVTRTRFELLDYF